MSVTIELAPEIEQQLYVAASRQGQDPAAFARTVIEEKLEHLAHATGDNGAAATEGQTLDKVLAGLTGVVNIGPSDMAAHSGEVFGEIVVEKFRKQGLDV